MLGWIKYIPGWLPTILVFSAAPLLFWLGSRGPHGRLLSIVAYLYAAGCWAYFVYYPAVVFRPTQYDLWIFALIFGLGFLHNKTVFLALAVGVLIIVPVGVYLTTYGANLGQEQYVFGALFHLIFAFPLIALLIGQWWYYRKLR